MFLWGKIESCEYLVFCVLCYVPLWSSSCVIHSNLSPQFISTFQIILSHLSAICNHSAVSTFFSNLSLFTWFLFSTYSSCHCWFLCWLPLCFLPCLFSPPGLLFTLIKFLFWIPQVQPAFWVWLFLNHDKSKTNSWRIKLRFVH